MGHPTGGEVSVATTTLRSEAQEWDTESAALSTLSGTTGGMEFGRLEAGIFQLMVGPYNTLTQLVTERCREGATAMTGIAAALHGVADSYDAKDEAAAGRLHKTTK
jgi:hypothetical protein